MMIGPFVIIILFQKIESHKLEQELNAIAAGLKAKLVEAAENKSE